VSYRGDLYRTLRADPLLNRLLGRNPKALHAIARDIIESYSSLLRVGKDPYRNREEFYDAYVSAIVKNWFYSENWSIQGDLKDRIRKTLDAIHNTLSKLGGRDLTVAYLHHYYCEKSLGSKKANLARLANVPCRY